MQSYWTSASGMQASLTWLDRISNNLANQATPGFAEQNGGFADAFTEALAPSATAGTAAGRNTLPGWWGGSGVIATSSTQNFSTMPLRATGVPTDLAIQGDGFFMVRLPNGTQALTKAGNFHISPTSATTSTLVTDDGYPVLDTQGRPVVIANNGVSQMAVGSDGQLSFGTASGPRIAMVTVPLPADTLVSAGQNLYTPTPGTVPAVANRAGGTGSAGTMVQGFVADSNVDMTTEMSSLIEAQRMFELNAAALQLTDKMSQTATTIKP